MRRGDIVFDADVRGVWIVDEHDSENVWTRKEGTGKTRQFERRRLECVDADDGLWQENENDE